MLTDADKHILDKRRTVGGGVGGGGGGEGGGGGGHMYSVFVLQKTLYVTGFGKTCLIAG